MSVVNKVLVGTTHKALPNASWLAMVRT